MTLTELKSEAYDCIAAIETLQRQQEPLRKKLADLNRQIAEQMKAKGADHAGVLDERGRKTEV